MKWSDCHILHNIITSAASNKGMTLSIQMVKQLHAELTAMGTFGNVEYEPDIDMLEEPKPAKMYNSLENLVQSNVDKALTTWQRNQLKRWDELLQAYPPNFPLTLYVEASQEVKEWRHQIKRIQEVSGVSKGRAENMYDSGIRVIEQE